MKLKRGQPRTSCNFCYRRKIKCDRSARAVEGLSACTPCDLRRLSCDQDCSDDIRIRSPRQTVLRGGGNTESSYSRSMTAEVIEGESVIQDTNAVAAIDIGEDSFLQISEDAISFLDQIFMTNEPPFIFEGEMSNPLGGHSMEEAQDHGCGTALSLSDIAIPSSLIEDSLRAYFDLVAPCLPILSEDAFWEDYDQKKCSDTLIYAVACRGVIFTSTDNKWQKQQSLANKFRETFLEGRKTAKQDIIRLDDLEALALMVNFQYDHGTGSPLQESVGNLLLTHDSLVLMTMRYRIDYHSSHPSDSSKLLSQRSKRRILLLWHVYGLDAFFNLETKGISRIRDEKEYLAECSSNDESRRRGYLDSIFKLATIARRIPSCLCNPTARREGVDIQKIIYIYNYLDRWRECFRPWSSDDDTSTSSLNVPRQNKSLKFQQTICQLLAANCYIEIGEIIHQYGIRDPDSLEGESLLLKVEYETLNATRRIHSVSGWLRQTMIQGSSGKEYALVNFCPEILRDICKGACYWICLRGLSMITSFEISHSTSSMDILPNRSVERAGGSVKNDRQLECYLQAARSLRNTVAAAASHRDTVELVAGLDEKIRLLEDNLVVNTRPINSRLSEANS
ncbi:hypothetical protein TSTA_124470 [Talaromyces stipitatus ATCC 10500]|uniref:Zn(2)-C6 fungal-type domain-containing protein n=1 Tax=Talaromyces stipitatus (strain ATCC 10500 / CBS 375.48 / QM 6759 / NRRL 1006) TaxID=441959 RepID=B8MB23_TALSN|nr:uncharacterized protein TSTA_124470 [Talaromyces stipitatus ATCC 10500]EED18724.1 hypothetical protein TSTA_124470 [Talaromyces stipitatus ATCC 10500]